MTRPAAIGFAAMLLPSCSFLEPQVGAPRKCEVGEAYGADAGDAGYVASAVPTGDASARLDDPSPAIYGQVSGNLLISDQYNNRVIEVTRGGAIVWSFGDGSFVPGPRSIVAPNDAERLPGGRTLIAATGGPAGTDPGCPAAGCPDNRVVIVDDASGAIVWQYGAFHGHPGSGFDQLNVPVAAVLVPRPGGDHVLITDQGNNRVIEVSQGTKETVWQFPPPGSKESINPNTAERLPDGNTLITDLAGNRVIEVNGDGTIVWQYPPRIDPHVLNNPASASRLADGHTLITDSLNGRVVEVDSSSPPAVVWSYSTAGRDPCGPPPQPSHAVRLANGHTVIADQFDEQIVEVDHGSPAKLLYTYGKLGVAGAGPGLLWAPYDAKLVGDYTGLTPPQ